MAQSEFPCRVCGATGNAEFATSDARYARCATCDTVQKQFSRDDYLAMDPGYDPGAFLVGASEAQVRAFLQIPSATTMMLGILRQPAESLKGKDFLDVGCGMGGYLLAARDMGMNVLGFEPSGNHSRVAVEELGLNVVPDYFTADKVGDRKFDVVMLSHVIEHIYDPAPFVAELVSVLKPGGSLVMVTPNADAITARLAGSYWPMLVPIDHVTMLAPKSVPHLVPAGCSCETTTSEDPYEFAAILASIAKRLIRGPATNHADMAPVAAPKTMMGVSWSSRLVRFGLSLVSFPFWILARATNRGGALRMLVRKPTR